MGPGLLGVSKKNRENSEGLMTHPFHLFRYLNILLYLPSLELRNFIVHSVLLEENVHVQCSV